MLFKEYTYAEDDKEVPVKPERWVWGVLYKDGTELLQFDSKGFFHRFSEIDQSRVKMFVMYPHIQAGYAMRIDMPVTPDMQIFHFYRNVKLHYKDEFVRVYVFGWKDRVTGSASYHFILPDDRMIVSPTDDVSLDQFGIT